MTPTELIHMACEVAIPGSGFAPIDAESIPPEIRTEVAPFVRDGGVPAWRVMYALLKLATEKTSESS